MNIFAVIECTLPKEAVHSVHSTAVDAEIEIIRQQDCHNDKSYYVAIVEDNDC
jgi:hypothetical protein